MDHRIRTLGWKMFKNKHAEKEIVQTILNTDEDTVSKMEKVKTIMLRHNICVPYDDQSAKNFIGEKIARYLQTNFPANFNPNSSVWADVGGANGNLLHYFATEYEFAQAQLFSVENTEQWTESYTFSHSDTLQYVEWNGTSTNLTEQIPHKLDVIFIMVTLHHMSDEIIQQLMSALFIMSKPGTLIILKEHDCRNSDDKFVIDWEHHLYHLLNNGNNLSAEEYLNEKYIDNYKPREKFDEIFQLHHFLKVDHLNRFLERTQELPGKNPSNLFWSVYKFVEA